MRRFLIKFRQILILGLFTITHIQSSLLDQCYSSGTNCIKLSQGSFELPKQEQIKNIQIPSHFQNTTISSRIVLSEVMNNLTLDNSSIAALIISAGNKNNIQWKISPTANSEHPIELNDNIDESDEIEDFIIHCFGIEDYSKDPRKLLVVPPGYQFFYSLKNYDGSCSSNDITIVPFKWNEISRQSLKAMSYFSKFNCTDTCNKLNLAQFVIRFCPHDNTEETTGKIEIKNDYIAEISDDLLGITLKKVNLEIEFPIGLIDCSNILDNYEKLGENSICLGDGENIAIKFGANPTFNFSEKVKTRLSTQTVYLLPPSNSVYPNFTVSYQPEIAKCNQSIQFEVRQISGNGFQPLKYQWLVINGSDEMKRVANMTSDRLLQIPRELVSEYISIKLIACNIAGKCTSSEPLISKLIDDALVFTVTMDGYEPETPNSFGLHLQANPSLNECSKTITPKEVQYEWHINGNVTVFDYGHKIPPYKYSPNEYVNITLLAQYSGTKNYTYKDSKIIHYIDVPIVVSLDCVQKQVSYNKDLIIRTKVFDESRINRQFEYSWECERSEKDSLNSSKCDIDIKKWHESYLKIESQNLIENTNMDFTVTVSSKDVKENASCRVVVGPTRLPIISFISMINKKYNVNDFIRVRALVSSSLSKLNMTWEIVRDSNYGYFNISYIYPNLDIKMSNVSSKSQVFLSLTIPPASADYPGWPGLLSGKTYIIRLWAENSKGSAFADYHLRTNSPPTIGKIDIKARDTPIIALKTPVTFSVGDGWNDDNDDFPLSYRFGYKVHYENSTGFEYWLSRSTIKSYDMYFASTSANISSDCDQIGYSALLSVCDRLGSCNTAESDMITVDGIENVSSVISDLTILLSEDVSNDNFLIAISKIYALNLELCTNNFDHTLTDKIVLLLFQSLNNSSQNSEYQEALEAVSTLLPESSPETLNALMDVLINYRKLSGKTTTTRKKRMTTTEEEEEDYTDSSDYEATETEATDMLNVYDILIGKNNSVVDVYFLNINDFLIAFCPLLDENLNSEMKAESTYTSIKTQNVNPNLSNYSGVFNISGNNGETVLFTQYFNTYFSSWNCGTTTSTTCRHVCLGSAKIPQEVLLANIFMDNYLFGDKTKLNVNKTVSDFYKIELIDPLSKKMLSSSEGQIIYSLLIPVNNYKPINFYNCYIYIDKSGWDITRCVSSYFATTVNNTYYIRCNCSSTGILSVFHSPSPTPDPLPVHNEILLTLILDSDVSTDDCTKIFKQLSNLSEVEYSRFVKVTNVGNKVVTAVLRPPFKSTHKENSYAVQCIERAIRYQKLLNEITVENFNYSVITRELEGDSNARKISMNLYRTYTTQLGNNTDDYAKKWAQSISNTLQISEFRIKNSKIFFGIVFNFTVTVPFTDEADPLSAEEIAIMIQECSKYGELEFTLQSEMAEINAISNSNIIKLVVIHETNSLMLALIIVLSIILGLGTLFIGGAVVVKIRTDKLIVEERRRAILHEQLHVPPPEYTNSQSSQVYRRTRLEARHY